MTMVLLCAWLASKLAWPEPIEQGFPTFLYSGAPLLLRSILQGPPDISSYTVLLQQREKCYFLNFFINQNICIALLFFYCMS